MCCKWNNPSIPRALTKGFQQVQGGKQYRFPTEVNGPSLYKHQSPLPALLPPHPSGTDPVPKHRPNTAPAVNSGVLCHTKLASSWATHQASSGDAKRVLGCQLMPSAQTSSAVCRKTCEGNFPCVNEVHWQCGIKRKCNCGSLMGKVQKPLGSVPRCRQIYKLL